HMWHDRADEEKMAVFVGKSATWEEMPQREHLSTGSQFVSTLLTQLPQAGRANRAGIVLRRFIDLPGGKFPDGSPNGHTLLVNEKNLPLWRLRHDDDGGFTVTDGPAERLRTRRRGHGHGVN